MYKTIYWTLWCIGFWCLANFVFLHAYVPTWCYVVSWLCFAGSAICVFTNTETDIERPKYWGAVILAIAGALVTVIVGSAAKFAPHFGTNFK